MESCMTQRRLIGAFVFGICTLFMTFSLDAQTTGAYKRLKFLENFTSTTCGPCAGAAPAINASVGLDKNVVSVRYHVPIPVAGDPWDAENPEDGEARRNFYGVNSAPTVIIGGTQGVSPTIAAIASAVASVPPTSFIKIDVSQDGGKILVKVKTDRALNNATMHFAMVSRHIVWPTVPGTNGEKEFYDVMNRMLPTAAGTPIAQAATEERTYEFTPSIGTGDTWKKGRQYVVVWIQQDPGQPNQGEVLQAGLSKTSTTPEDYMYPTTTGLALTIPGNRYLRVDRGAEATKAITIANASGAPVTVTLSIKEAQSLEQVGMVATVEPATLIIPANGNGSATIKVTGANRSILVSVSAALAASDGLGKGVDPIYYLVNGGKIVNYYGLSGQGPITSQIISGSLPSYSEDVVYMPYATEFNNAYPMAGFDAAVFALDAYWLAIRGATLTAIEDMLKAKKGVWIQSQAGMTAAYSRYPTDATFDATRAWYKNVVGIEYVKGEPRATQNGQQITLLPIPVKGVSKDPIGDGVAFTGNGYSQAWTYYNQAVTDIMKKTANSTATSVLYMDNLTANIGMVRVQPTYGGRLVYSSIGTEIMSDEVQRKKLVKAVFDWLLNVASTKPSITVSSSTLNFGSVQVDASKEMSLTVTNSGSSELSITDVSIKGADATAFDVVSGGPVNGIPVKVAVGASLVVKVSFNPLTQKSNYGAALEFTTNADNSPTVQLRGAGTTTSVATEAISETGAISMVLVGSNPVTSNSAVRISAQGNITVTVVDAAGRVVSSIFDGSVNGSENVALTASSLASGTYSIVASNGTDRAVLTVMVVR